MALRLVAAGLAGTAYLLGSHWLMTRAPASPWNAVVIVAPMLVVAAVVALQRRQRAVAIALALATAALFLQADRGGGGVAAETLYLGQHVAIHVLLAFVFGSTLAAGREPLVSALARRVHGSLTPAMGAYSRKVTVAWTIYFVAMAALSIVVFATAPFSLWASFANLVTPLAMAAMFVGEYLLRYRLHPEFERATLAQAVRAYADRAAPHE